MIDTDALFIAHYCHPDQIPFQNICRLPEKEAFSLAYEMAAAHPNTTAFYRFADFENYYPLRMKTDAHLYDTFVSLGGKPKEKHPLSFVLQGSEYLHGWFDGGSVYYIPLKEIPSACISFTWSDSGATLQRTGVLTMYTKEMLFTIMKEYKGSINDFMAEIIKNHHYIEVQLWDDAYCKAAREQR